MRLFATLAVVACAGCGGGAGTSADGGSTTAALTAAPAATEPTTTAESPTTEPTTTTGTTVATAVSVTDASTTTAAPIVRRVPLGDGVRFSYGREHGGYPATDLFADCGSPVVAPIAGTLLEVRTVDGWDPATDNPATRGGRSIALLGDDGVRYYMAHFSAIEPTLAPGDRVVTGQPLGQVGRTGRASACHVHFGLSPPCPGREWKVRRGVIPPAPYLDSWRAGENAGPELEILAWLEANPDGCADALAEPTAADA